jgi:hypothetical protein
MRIVMNVCDGPFGSPAFQNARSKIKFNGDGGLRTYILAHIKQRVEQNMKIFSQKTVVRGDSIPVIVSVIVAVVGTVGILVSDLGAGNDSQRTSNARMITAAAVSKAGAIEIPSGLASLG